MVSLRIFSLVMVTLGCRELAADEVPELWLAPWLSSSGVVLGFGLLFKFSVLNILAGNTAQDGMVGIIGVSGREWSCRRMHRVRNRVELAWIAALPAALLSTGLGQNLNALENAGMSQAIVMLAWFLPTMAFVLLLELTAAQFDELTTPDSAPAAGLSWAAHLRLRLRLGDFASLLTCVLPVAVIGLGADIADQFVTTQAAYAALATATLVALVGMLLSFPSLLSRWMGTKALPEQPLRERIEGMSRKLGLQDVDIQIVPSHGRWVGAAIVGWIPGFRKLWLGDALIERLTEHQLDMVVMHELAHVDRKHCWWRALPLLWAAASVGLLWLLWPMVAESEPVRNLVAAVVASVVLLMGMGRTARACELDADRHACTLAERVCGWANGQPSVAAAQLGSALATLVDDFSTPDRATWLHPSLRQRLTNLNRSPQSNPPRVVRNAVNLFD